MSTSEIQNEDTNSKLSEMSNDFSSEENSNSKNIVSEKESEDSSILPEDLPADIIAEGKKLQKQIEREEAKRQRKLEQEKLEKEQHELRYKRLMHLLDRSQFYSNFLMSKLQTANEVPEKENKESSAQSAETSSRKRGRSPENAEGEDEKPKKRGKRVVKAKNDILSGLGQDRIQQLAEHKAPEKNAEKTVEKKEPPLFENGTMRQYQLEGFQWLVALYENGMNGILADEMGLGKTIQCIGLICHLIGKGVIGPYLICGPLSVVSNWMNEFARFAPKVPTLLYHGSADKRRELLGGLKQKYKIPGLPSHTFFPVVVTSYEVVIKDRPLLDKFPWRYIIVDEGHRLKNFQCRLIQELKKYRSANRLLLTGTPLQNNLSELWSLLNFLLPEIFDDLDVFQAWFHVEELQGEAGEEKILELERKEKILTMLHQILSPFLLRRVKTDVDLQIPPKKEVLVYCPLSSLQEKLYRATADKTIAQLLGLETKQKEVDDTEYDEKGRPVRKSRRATRNYSDYGTEENELTNKHPELVDKEIEDWIRLSEHHDSFRSPRLTKKEKAAKSSLVRVKMQNPMMQLRKIVNHPYLVDWPLDSPDGDFILDETLVTSSGKMAVLDQMLKRLRRDGHKVLIFSQMVMLLDIIEDYLGMRQFGYARLDGTRSLEDRSENISRFNQDPDVWVFLISTRAGGLGINLTAADTVIIYDSDWNPQADLQAQDRCHRIGQTKPVVVYRLVTANTIDQQVIDRAAAKRKLEKMVIQEGKFKSALKSSSKSSLTESELLELLKARDYKGVYRGTSGQVFSEPEMDALMNRSDLLLPGDEAAASPIENEVSGIFKVLENPNEQ